MDSKTFKIETLTTDELASISGGGLLEDIFYGAGYLVGRVLGFPRDLNKASKAIYSYDLDRPTSSSQMAD